MSMLSFCCTALYMDMQGIGGDVAYVSLSQGPSLCSLSSSASTVADTF